MTGFESEAVHNLSRRQPSDSIWLLPDGRTMAAQVYDRYLGLEGQERVGLVDSNGRVHHYDLTEIEEVAGDGGPVRAD